MTGGGRGYPCRLCGSSAKRNLIRWLSKMPVNFPGIIPGLPVESGRTVFTGFQRPLGLVQ